MSPSWSDERSADETNEPPRRSRLTKQGDPVVHRTKYRLFKPDDVVWARQTLLPWCPGRILNAAYSLHAFEVRVSISNPEEYVIGLFDPDKTIAVFQAVDLLPFDAYSHWALNGTRPERNDLFLKQAINAAMQAVAARRSDLLPHLPTPACEAQALPKLAAGLASLPQDPTTPASDAPRWRELALAYGACAAAACNIPRQQEATVASLLARREYGDQASPPGRSGTIQRPGADTAEDAMQGADHEDGVDKDERGSMPKASEAHSTVDSEPTLTKHAHARDVIELDVAPCGPRDSDPYLHGPDDGADPRSSMAERGDTLRTAHAVAAAADTRDPDHLLPKAESARTPEAEIVERDCGTAHDAYGCMEQEELVALLRLRDVEIRTYQRKLSHIQANNPARRSSSTSRR